MDTDGGTSHRAELERAGFPVERLTAEQMEALWRYADLWAIQAGRSREQTLGWLGPVTTALPDLHGFAAAVKTLVEPPGARDG